MPGYLARKDPFAARALPPDRPRRGGRRNIAFGWDDVLDVGLDIVSAPILAPVSIATGKRPSALIRGGAEEVQQAAASGGDTLKSILKTGGQLIGSGLLATGKGLTGSGAPAPVAPAPQPFNYTPWLIGGGAALGLILILATRKKHH